MYDASPIGPRNTSEPFPTYPDLNHLPQGVNTTTGSLFIPGQAGTLSVEVWHPDDARFQHSLSYQAITRLFNTSFGLFLDYYFPSMFSQSVALYNNGVSTAQQRPPREIAIIVEEPEDRSMQAAFAKTPTADRFRLLTPLEYLEVAKRESFLKAQGNADAYVYYLNNTGKWKILSLAVGAFFETIRPLLVQVARFSLYFQVLTTSPFALSIAIHTACILGASAAMWGLYEGFNASWSEENRTSFFRMTYCELASRIQIIKARANNFAHAKLDEKVRLTVHNLLPHLFASLVFLATKRLVYPRFPWATSILVGSMAGVEVGSLIGTLAGLFVGNTAGYVAREVYKLTGRDPLSS